jgi:preprotein translocase subunit SecA
MLSIKHLFGDQNTKTLRSLQPIIEKINLLEKDISSYSDGELRGKTDEFRKLLKEGRALDDILAEAFGVVREVALRTLKQRHFDVQLMGGIVLHRGGIAEMKTGEGKTLVATLPAYLNALTGEGVHIVTVNDYLARRDAVWMGQIYHFLGLTVGCINHDASYLYDPLLQSTKSELGQNPEGKESGKELDRIRDTLGSFKVVHEFLRPCTRREAYEADVTYGTNNEFGFDYLRDNTALDPSDLRQREHAYAIVDEIDSILIDEARTPLIISMPSSESESLYAVFAQIARQLKEGEDYTVDEKFKSVALTDMGIGKAEKLLGIDNIYTERGIKYVHHLETAVRAKALFHRDKDYVVRDGEVVIVDEFTGRLQPGRRWSEGLHQAIEAKEGVRVQRESRTAASITFQNYFRLYRKLSGMTGTAMTSAEEFYKVYGLETVAIPTNKPMIRKDNNDLIFQTERGKFQAIARTVKELNKKGQPVLIGTVSIEKNELLSSYLKKEGIQHQVLNAKDHEREGEIIARAGIKGRVTVATNMAGRGVDIKLGGDLATPEEYEEVKSLGGLFVLGTERHEARRIDNQLRGRAGRQGDPGETQFFVSLEDPLMRVFASDTIKKMMGRFGIPEDQPIENSLITRSLESAQTKIEGFHFDARKHVLAYDNVLNNQRQSVYERRRKILLGDNADIEGLLNEAIADDEELKKITETKKAELGDKIFYSVLRRLFLQTIDMFWIEHLEVMDYMRGSVNLRAYGQRDPLVEYKKEGLRLFREMQEAVDDQIRTLLPHINEGTFKREEEQSKKLRARTVFSAASLAAASERVKNQSSMSHAVKIGRNDPCPCGAINPTTGEVYKYKKCGLIGAPHHRQEGR